MSRAVAGLVCVLSGGLIGASAVSAQPLGTFRWQTAPFCNLVTLTVTQSGGVFTLHGCDEQCGSNLRQPLHGIAIPQPDGTVTLGLNVVQMTDLDERTL